MAKKVWEGSPLLCPVPVVMVTSGDFENANIITVAWTGIINSDPPMTYVSIRRERFSHHLISENKEFCINLVTENLTFRTDFCGVKSGEKFDKFSLCHFEKEPCSKIKTAQIKESPLTLECVVTDVISLPSHNMFIAKIVAVNVDEQLLNKNGKLDMTRANLTAYSHGEYFSLGKKLGKFGYSVKKK